MRRKRSFYNLFFGTLGQIVTIAFGILIPRMFILSYGSEVNGFLSSVSQMLVYLNLMEAGVGTTTIQSLYNSIANNKKQDTNAILAATDHYYKKTGAVYFFCVLGLAFLYPLIIKSDIPAYVIILTILMNGMASVINFFFQGKYKLLLQAEGKTFVITNMTTVVQVLISTSKIALIAAGANVLTLQLVYFIISILQMTYILWYVKRHYDWLDLKVKPNFKALEQKNSVLVLQVCDLVFRNTDTIVLTVICQDLKIVSVYALYNMLFGMISTFMNTIVNSFTFVLGQEYHKSWDRFIKMHDVYELYYMTLVFSLFTVAYVFIVPFIKLYTAGVTDIDYLQYGLPFLFVLINLLSCGRASSNQVITYAKHFSQTKYRCIAEATINLVVSIVAAHFVGIYGVLLGTVVALLYRANDMIWYANKRILHRSPVRNYKRWGINFVIFLTVVVVNHYLPVTFDNYLQIIPKLITVGLPIIISYFLIMSLVEKETCKWAIELLMESEKFSNAVHVIKSKIRK